MSLRLTNRYTTFFLLGGCLLFCTGYIGLSMREAFAAHAAQQHTLADLQRAVRLSQANAEYHAALGTALLFSGDWEGARIQLKTATTLNPHQPGYWLDLSRTQQIAGNAGEARAAAGQALASGQTYSWVLWEAGLLFLSQGDHGSALQVFHKALQTGALPADRVVEVCWRATGSTELMLNSLLPEQPQPYSALIEILASEGRSREADIIWQHLLRAGRDFPPSVSFGYIDFLLRQGRSAHAAEAWRSFLHSNSSVVRYADSGNLVENGGFELPLLNGGLDWRYASRPDATVSLDQGYSNSGSRSVKLTFQANELWEAPLVQYVAVQPETKYRLSASVSTRDLWTLSGPRLRVRDTLGSSEYLLSDQFSGSTPWTRVGHSFTTGPNTHMVTVSLVRTPGASPIHGSLWLDDVSLEEVR